MRNCNLESFTTRLINYLHLRNRKFIIAITVVTHVSLATHTQRRPELKYYTYESDV